MIVGYSLPGDTDTATSAAKEMICARFLVADLAGEDPAYVKARIGHSGTGQWTATVWDEAGNALCISSGNYFGSAGITVVSFTVGPGCVVPGTDTYFYVSIQWDVNVGTFQYESSIDSFFYDGAQTTYQDLILDPFPTDNHAGTPCIWVTTGDVPANTSAPVATGSAEVGAVLSCSTGSWTNTPTSYQYQWYVNDVLQPGETNSTYTVQAGDLGLLVNCRVYATNSNGQSASSTPSNYLGPVTTPSGDPTNITPPTVTGDTNLMGVVLTTDDGVWTGVPTSFTYQWKRDCGGGLVTIDGETANTYTTQPADIGCYVACEVTAYN